MKGEVHITPNFAGMDLPITALVLDKTDCDILAGIPFFKINDIVVHLKDEYITIKDLRFHMEQRIAIVCNDTAKVVIPGEFVEIYADELNALKGK